MRRLTALFLACLPLAACTNRDVPIDWRRSQVIAQGDRPQGLSGEPVDASPPRSTEE